MKLTAFVVAWCSSLSRFSGFCGLSVWVFLRFSRHLVFIFQESVTFNVFLLVPCNVGGSRITWKNDVFVWSRLPLHITLHCDKPCSAR
ncbi:hypothetical protein F4604DRAFT_1795268 [Suillus subluteus]|nr:hypothetical protein F4604DRAFT_1795268 [Suillus subluteus]